MNKFYKIFLLALLCLPGQHCFGGNGESVRDFLIAHILLKQDSQPYQMKLKALDDYNKTHPTETWQFLAAGLAGVAVAAGVVYYMRDLTEGYRSTIRGCDRDIDSERTKLAEVRKQHVGLREGEVAAALKNHPAFQQERGPLSIVLEMMHSEEQKKADEELTDTINGRLAGLEKYKRAQRVKMAAINGSLFAGTFLLAAPISLVALNIMLEKPEPKALLRDCMNMLEEEVLRMQMEELTTERARLKKIDSFRLNRSRHFFQFRIKQALRFALFVERYFAERYFAERYGFE
jgi:hypothetical protein